MWSDVGINRKGARLEVAAATISPWQETLPEPGYLADHELGNMVLLGRIVAEAASLRRDSRRSHFREDYPEANPDWERHIVLTQEEEVR